MSRTLEEFKDELKRLDELTLLEFLNLSSEELVEAFEDRIADLMNDGDVEEE